MNIRDLARKSIPFPIRVEILRLRRLPRCVLETPTIARNKLTEEEAQEYPFTLACLRSPLRREIVLADTPLQAGKEYNVGLAARMLDRLEIRPYQIFSYHRIVGGPARIRGFRTGLELHGGEISKGVGGGCCQVSNALYLLALRAGMKIVERHRHGFDLFPDHDRTVPFGCGATIFYNYVDLRFENPLPQSVLLRAKVVDGQLECEIRTTQEPGWTVGIYEIDHRFFKEGDGWVRENRIRRRIHAEDGSLVLDQEVAHNRGRVMYDLPGEAACGEQH